ncbi:MAG TPA: RdgB/HAM1 family non-canonical purine NTP pyrophosphatase [Bacteroidales bacterium]|nr:RdgB/HAM1 family non-canonical purine NTP pyrophosphatase [Bacteroidales bacterium]
MEIIFATQNPHKLHEIQHLLGTSFLLKSLKELNFSEDIPETQATLEGNALEKARFIYKRYGKACFADDTGLEVTALNGAPGVYSARYAGSLSDFGTEQKRSAANIQKLLGALKEKNDNTARFRTVIAYIDSQGKEHLFDGIVTGSILSELRGDGGFGYDPVFVPDGYNETFAEMPLSSKNKISHRARAFKSFHEFLMKSE